MIDQQADPFDGDLFRRADLAKKLTPFVDRLKAGGTIGIDANWGEGKTWFGIAWKKQLEREGHKVAYIDAFAHDYVDDPFVLVAAELSKLLEPGNAPKKIAEKAGSVMRSLAPLAVKASVGLAGRILLGVSDVEGEVKKALEAATDAGAEAGKKWLESAVAGFEAEKKSVEGFRNTLTEAAAAVEKSPVIVFIDELDRCKPSFAIAMLERIKHLFEVPNLVIVLLLNRTQLEAAIKGAYGESYDARTYLSKFMSVWFDLPQARTGSINGSEPNVGPFVHEVIQRYGGHTIEDFAGHMQAWTVAFNMSLRDIERCCLLAVVASGKRARLPALFAYLLALKIKRPDDFRNIRTSDKAHHVGIANWLDTFCADRNEEPADWPGWMLLGFASMHRELAGQAVGDEFRAHQWSKYRSYLIGSSDPKDAIAKFAEMIDFPLGV